MKIDTVAALQGIVDTKEKRHLRSPLVDEIRAAIGQVSHPGKYGRSVFELNDLLAELAKVDFGSDRVAVRLLMECLSQSLISGLIVAEGEEI